MNDHEQRTPIDLARASASDPHLQPAAQNPADVERRIAVLFILGFVATAGFGAAFWTNQKPWILGATMGASLTLLGVGLVAWGKYLMARGPFVEERHDLRSTDEEREAFAATLADRGGEVVQRRKMLGGLLSAGLGTFAVVAIFPLLRSLGPVPGTTLQQTNWKKGSFLVDSSGRRLHVDDMSIGSISGSVFPEKNYQDVQAQSQDQTVVVRVATTDFTTKRGRETWGPAGYLAYSKLCTHLGCPVGLYEQELELLVCPCHQSMFNVRNGAIPQFGPAPRPLPQLPLYVDNNGYLRSQSGFHEAVGPGFWERS